MSTSIEVSERRKGSTANGNSDLKLEETQNSSSITICNALETDLQTVESITTVVASSLSVVSTQLSSKRTDRTQSSDRTQYSEMSVIDQLFGQPFHLNDYNMARRLQRQSDVEAPTFLMFTWTRRFGVSPTIPIRAVFYAIIVFYLLVGFRRLKIRVEDWSYQHENEPELLSLWNYVPPIVADIILFELIPLGSLLHIAILDIAFKWPKFAHFIDWFTPCEFTNFFLFTQFVVFVHSILELINVLFVFFVQIERIWWWLLVFYRLAVLSFDVYIMSYTNAIRFTAEDLTDWALDRRRRLAQNN
ncbi:hypothetical protein M3Y94_01308300 [Aphelenchoides besseyi]|nr:hypothetical protein M3Y94_01308300 [Aphelenchoides besseyi]KAI6220248.1 hypothetical protein M3Y95_01064900 [Aphelenchoides besseyi]